MVKKRPTPTSAVARRRALRRNQLASFILHGSLTTTEARAKRLRSEVERLVARARSSDLSTRRRILAFLPDKRAAKKLFESVVPQFADRTGGFVRVIKLPPRRGDNTPMARVEFVEEISEKAGEEKAPKGKRTERARPKKEHEKKGKKASSV